MFVKLINGPEPFIVNIGDVVALEGIEGGRACMVILSNGGTRRVPMPADTVVRLCATAKDDDWIEGGDKVTAPVTARPRR